MNEIAEINENELSKVSNNLLNAEQLNFLFKKTPAKYTYKRPAKGGGTWTYITGNYAKKVLNLMFGWAWNFTVEKFDINMDAKQAIVLGKLIVETNGKEIIKMQFGRADIKFRTARDKDGNKISTDIPLDLGNDLKAATTDALKKCASELGIAGDIYGANEYKEIAVTPEETFGEKHKIQMSTIRSIDELEMYYDSHPEFANNKEFIDHFKKIHDDLSGINQEIKD